jgi:hypothetical protein
MYVHYIKNGPPGHPPTSQTHEKNPEGTQKPAHYKLTLHHQMECPILINMQTQGMVERYRKFLGGMVELNRL